MKNGRDAQAEAVRCTMKASREAKMEIPANSDLEAFDEQDSQAAAA